jgi:hypothetical protein
MNNPFRANYNPSNSNAPSVYNHSNSNNYSTFLRNRNQSSFEQEERDAYVSGAFQNDQ